MPPMRPRSVCLSLLSWPTSWTLKWPNYGATAPCPGCDLIPRPRWECCWNSVGKCTILQRFGVSKRNFFFFIKECSKLIKIESKDDVTKDFHLKSAVYFSVSSFLKMNYHFHKRLIIDTFLEQHVNLLEGFLRDNVALKTRVITLKIQLCITGINYFKIYPHRKQFF